MPRLIDFLRQYGPREYLLMLSVAAICGLGVAALINAASGDVAGGQALLKSKAQLEADSSRVLTTRVFKPVRSTHPRRRHARQHQRRHVRHHRSAPAPAPAAPSVVAVSAPAPAPKPAIVQRQIAPRPAPRPVVRAPRPAPKPAPAPKRSSGGGGQFDDSG